MTIRFTLRTADGRAYAIQGPFRIGRDRDCEICLDSGLVSHIHASIWLDHGHLMLRDERSRNGTFVNGRRLKPGANQYLHDGDHLRLADAVLTVIAEPVQESPPEQSPAAAAPETAHPETAHRAVSTPDAPAAPPLAPTRAMPEVPPLPLTRAAPYEPAPASSRSRTLAIAGGCVALALLCVCVLGVVGLGAANRSALSTALAPLGLRAPTPGPGTSSPGTPVPTRPAQPGNISVQVLPTLPTATPMAPAAYAANSQAVAAALGELNQAQLHFIHDADTSGLTSGSLIDDLLQIAAAAFKLASDAENLFKASAAQGGGSAEAGQVADLYAGLAKYGYAQALDAQNLRLALANGTLDSPSAAARVSDFGARAWNPSVTDPAAPGNPFLPAVGNSAAIPAAAPLSDAGAAALQTSLGPEAGLQSWIAAAPQTVTRTVAVPRPILPLGDPQDPALLASLITAAGQADGDQASQAAAAGLQRLGATITRSTGSHSALKKADMAAQSIGDALDFADTVGMIMSADQKPGGHNPPAFPGGTGAALAKKSAPAGGGDDAFINNVFGLSNDNTPTRTGQTPVTTAVPLVTLSISNVQINQVDQRSTFENYVEWTFDVAWQTSLINARLTIDCNSYRAGVFGPSGSRQATGTSLLHLYPGTMVLSCSAGDRYRAMGFTTLRVLVGDPAEATQRVADLLAEVKGTQTEAAHQATLTQQEIERKATQTQAALNQQNTLGTEQAATQTAEHIAQVTQAAAETAAAQAAGIFTLNGTFNLVQSDSGCSFADAPHTSGTVQMNVNFNTGQATATFAGGGGGTRSLTCKDDTGSMHWQQSYTANFAGSVDPSSGALALSGTLTGSNNVSWSDCKHAGESTSCPASYARGYSFPVTLGGTVDKNSHSGSGTWQVQKISLSTSGDWGGGQ